MPALRRDGSHTRSAGGPLANASDTPPPQDIYVRAHAPIPSGKRWKQKRAEKWPSYALVFDTESTIDTKQKLTIGCFRRCKLEGKVYECIEEGLFYADSLAPEKLQVLQSYIDNPTSVPDTRRFPPQIRLTLADRNSFIRRVFWRAVKRGDLIVGFNLPFDLSRLAVKSSSAKKGGGWSLELTLRKSRKIGKMELDPERPRIVITSQNSKSAFIRVSSHYRPREWPNQARFLDLRTLTFALRNRSYDLERACGGFHVQGKLKHKASGRVTFKEIKYCRKDVAATAGLLNAAKSEFDRNPIKLKPDEASADRSASSLYRFYQPISDR